MSTIIANVLGSDGNAFAQVGFYQTMVYNPMAGMQVPGVSWKFLNLKSRAELTGIMQGNDMVTNDGNNIGTVLGLAFQTQIGAEFTIYFQVANLGSRLCKVIEIFASNNPPRSLAGIPNMPSHQVLSA